MKLRNSFLSLNNCAISLYCKPDALLPPVLCGCGLAAYAPLCVASSESVSGGNIVKLYNVRY